MRRFRLRKVALMAVSLALSAGLWALVAGEQAVERTMRVPLEFSNQPPRLEPVGDVPSVVDVRIRGASAAVSRLAAGDVLAALDLRQARAGFRLFHLGPSDVRAPFSVEIVQVMPSSVALRFEPTETKLVRVAPSVEGQPAPGFRVGTVTADPPTVVVAGPRSALLGLTEAITEPVSVEGATGPVTDDATVGVVDPSVRLPSVRAVRVTVTLERVPHEP